MSFKIQELPDAGVDGHRTGRAWVKDEPGKRRRGSLRTGRRYGPAEGSAVKMAPLVALAAGASWTRNLSVCRGLVPNA